MKECENQIACMAYTDKAGFKPAAGLFSANDHNQL